MSAPPPPTQKTTWKWIDIILFSLCMLVIALFYWIFGLFRAGGGGLDTPAFILLSRSWNDETGWSHGWFITPAILAILWKNRQGIRQTPIEPSVLGLFWVVLALCFYVIAIRTLLWRVAIGALPILLYGIVVFLWGTKRAKFFIFPLALFYFCVPIPGIIEATNSLQLLVTKCAANLASFIGIPLELTGNKVFLLGKGDFDVDEGCSGIRSLMALNLIAFVYGYFAHHEGWKRAIIFLSAIPLAIVANIIRIFSILFVADKISVTFAQTIYHDKIGFFSFALALGLLLLLSRILGKGFKSRARTIIRKSTS